MNKNPQNRSSNSHRSLLGRDFQDSILPERLRNSIQDQQERSEILISVIQLVIVFTFGFTLRNCTENFFAGC